MLRVADLGKNVHQIPNPKSQIPNPQSQIRNPKSEISIIPLFCHQIKTEAAAIGGLLSWSSCTVPLTVVANRELYADGHEQTWLLMDTKEVDDPGRAHPEYHLRTALEERHRQFKCFCDLTDFTSRAFSMVVNQTVFIFLAYNLLQIYLLRQNRQELNKMTLPLIRRQLLPSDSHIIVYWQNYHGLFSPLEFTGYLVTLDEPARKKNSREMPAVTSRLEPCHEQLSITLTLFPFFLQPIFRTFFKGKRVFSISHLETVV